MAEPGRRGRRLRGDRGGGFGNAADMGEIPNARDGDAHRGGVRSAVIVPGDVSEGVGGARLFIDQTIEPALRPSVNAPAPLAHALLGPGGRRRQGPTV